MGSGGWLIRVCGCKVRGGIREFGGEDFDEITTTPALVVVVVVMMVMMMMMMMMMVMMMTKVNGEAHTCLTCAWNSKK